MHSPEFALSFDPSDDALSKDPNRVPHTMGQISCELIVASRVLFVMSISRGPFCSVKRARANEVGEIHSGSISTLQQRQFVHWIGNASALQQFALRIAGLEHDFGVYGKDAVSARDPNTDCQGDT